MVRSVADRRVEATPPQSPRNDDVTSSRQYNIVLLVLEAPGLRGLLDDALTATKSGKNKQILTSWDVHDVSLSDDSLVGVFGLAASYPLLLEELMSKLMGLLIVALSLPHSKQWEACWQYVMGVVDLTVAPTGRGSSLEEDPGSSLDVAGRADTEQGNRASAPASTVDAASGEEPGQEDDADSPAARTVAEKHERDEDLGALPSSATMVGAETLGRMESQARQQKPPRQRSPPQVQRHPPLISQPTAQQYGHPHQLPRLPPPRHGGSTATCVHSWWKRWWRCTRRDRRWRRSPHASASTAPRWRGTSSRQGKRCAPTQPTLPSKSGCGRPTPNSERSNTPRKSWASARMRCGRWCGGE